MSSLLNRSIVFRLSTDNGQTFTDIKEPINFNQAVITMKRGYPESYGVDIEFIQDEQQLGFTVNSGYDVIWGEWQTLGVNANVNLYIYYKNTLSSPEELLFEGTLLLKDHTREFYTHADTTPVLYCPVKRTRFKDSIWTNRNTEISLGRNTTFSGKTIANPLPKYRAEMFSQILTERFVSYEPRGLVNGTAIGTEYDLIEAETTQMSINLGFTNVTTSQLAGHNNLDTQFDALLIDPTLGTSFKYPFYQVPDNGEFRFSGRYEFSVNLFKTALVYYPNPQIVDDTDILTASVRFIVTRPTGVDNKADFVHNQTLQSKQGTFVAQDARFELNDDLDGTFNVVLNLQKGDLVYMAIMFDFTGSPNGYWIDPNPRIDGTTIVSNNNRIEIEADTEFEETGATFFKIDEVFKYLIEVFTDEVDVFLSAFLTLQEGGQLFLSSGLNIRGFPDEDSYPVITWNKLIQSLKAHRDISVSFEKRDFSGTIKDVVVLEDIEYFFDSSQIVDQDNNTRMNAEYTEIADKTIMYSKINVGYEKVVQSELKEGAVLNDFHTTRTYKTPIQTHDQELNLISPFRMSGVGIEKARREQYSLDQTKDTTFDNDVFMLWANIDLDKYSTSFYSKSASYDPDEQILAVVGDYRSYQQAKEIRFSFLNAGLTAFRAVIISTNYNEVSGVTTWQVEPNEILVNVSGTVQVNFYTDTLIPHRDEDFIYTDNILFPDKTYNIRSQPIRSVTAHSLSTNIGFANMDTATNYIRFSSGKTNVDVTTRLKANVQLLDRDTRKIFMKGSEDYTLDAYNDGEAIAIPVRGEITKAVDLDEILTMKQIFENVSGIESKGYHRYSTPEGDKDFWITEVSYNPLGGDMVFTGLIANTNYNSVPPEPTLSDFEARDFNSTDFNTRES